MIKKIKRGAALLGAGMVLGIGLLSAGAIFIARKRFRIEKIFAAPAPVENIELIFAHVKVIVMTDLSFVGTTEEILNTAFLKKYGLVVITHKIPRFALEEVLVDMGLFEPEELEAMSDEEVLAEIPAYACDDADVVRKGEVYSAVCHIGIKYLDRDFNIIAEEGEE